MQMVAAAKLRRAQEAAEAARPYAERMGAVLAIARAKVVGGDGAPKLLAGTGKDQVHLLVVMHRRRGLCGGFNSSIVKARGTRTSCWRRARRSRSTVGKKGRDSCAATSEADRRGRLRERQALGLRQRRSASPQSDRAVRGRRVRRRTLFYSASSR
jgi:F-type H+-transporting ATPase subunit gamma